MSSYDYLRSIAILTPTNSLVDDINDFVIEKIPGKTHTYFIQDSIDDNGGEDNDFNTTFLIEYLNSINMTCLSKHELQIKNVRLHAFIPLELLIVFSQTFAEGNIYEIVHFRCVRGLKTASENSSPIKIYFSQSTIVKHVISNDWSVPLQKYHFVSLQNFTNNVGNNYSHDGLDDSPLAASGRAFITNLPFSAIYVNPDIPEVEAVRNRYLQC
ncbi:uncharacterized protein LOC141701156 [Apium graveolens]|uniref:uncharacterized protein LOC141701156 n=1 Tax=Apium graveolens TaxID=4045 RepID=UPI003D7A4D48